MAFLVDCQGPVGKTVARSCLRDQGLRMRKEIKGGVDKQEDTAREREREGERGSVGRVHGQFKLSEAVGEGRRLLLPSDSQKLSTVIKYVAL